MTTTTTPGVLDHLVFQHPFRRYQRFALRHVEEVLGTADDDGRFHLVAPPGSGKTILGIELARRFGRPTLVLAPTTAIVEQWRSQVALFLDDDADLDAVVSTTPDRLAPITVLTYQVVSTPAGNEPLVLEAARESWIAELMEAERVDDVEAARERLTRLREHNRRTFDRELSRRARRHKRALLRGGEVDVRRFLHDNARTHLERLTAHGVGTVVLDECHHLLDHWAVVVRSLLDGLDDPRVVGLTATLPDPDTPAEFENYDELLGDVDIEVPVPAVVKEGELAPFRDNVYFVEPTDAEDRYIGDVEGAFERAVAHITDREAFHRWLRRPLENTEGRIDADGVAAVLREDPLLGLARLRMLTDAGDDLDDAPVPRDARDPAGADERARVVADHALDELRVSEDPADHALVEELRGALRPFGFSLTERGLRQIRAPGDLVLAYSEAKQRAAADILEREAEELGGRLRAVVVTDFERTGRGVATVGEALASDAGSARRAFRTLIERPALEWLEPVLLTGQTVWIDEQVADDLLGFADEWLTDNGIEAELTTAPCDVPGAVELTGRGRAWSPRTYVRMLTAAFEVGVTRCLVGTRGLLGEGWDALRLNTLIDLTSVTTAQSVQQLRGRSLRLDPSWPHKVAHNWDVVCVDPLRAHGDRDLRRLRRRHRRVWGVVEMPMLERVTEQAAEPFALRPKGEEPLAPPRMHGQVVRGLGHVDVPLVKALGMRPWDKVRYDNATSRSLHRIGDRQDSYELWGIGEEYADAHAWTAEIRPLRGDVRTIARITGLASQLARALRAAIIGILLFVAVHALDAVLQTGFTPEGLLVISVLLGIAVVTSLAMNARLIWRLGRMLLRDQPPDAIVGDVGRAVLAGLRDADLVHRSLREEQVRVAVDASGVPSVLLEHASHADTERFVRACTQVLGPVVDPRYLIRRDDRRLPEVGARWLWVPLRTALTRRLGEPVGYHPVPDDLGVNRQRADAFARAWKRHVGGGELIHTRSDEGWRALLDARAAERPTATSLAYERWW
jgi:superfamily II DNA or RNA helicase